jgi:hypothetical protein
VRLVAALVLLAALHPAQACEQHERPLRLAEISEAREVFGGSLDLAAVKIVRGGAAALGASRTIGDTIYLQDGEFAGSCGLDLDPDSTTLIHELTHVWQFQHGGASYIAGALSAQLGSVLTTGERDAAYDYTALLERGTPWESWNPEQQASLVEDYERAVRSAYRTTDERQLVRAAQPYLRELRAGRGAAGGGAAS